MIRQMGIAQPMPSEGNFYGEIYVAANASFNRMSGYIGADAVLGEVSAVSKLQCHSRCIRHGQCSGYTFDKTLSQRKMISHMCVDQPMPAEGSYYGEIYVTASAPIIRNSLARGKQLPRKRFE